MRPGRQSRGMVWLQGKHAAHLQQLQDAREDIGAPVDHTVVCSLYQTLSTAGMCLFWCCSPQAAHASCTSWRQLLCFNLWLFGYLCVTGLSSLPWSRARGVKNIFIGLYVELWVKENSWLQSDVCTLPLNCAFRRRQLICTIGHVTCTRTPNTAQMRWDSSEVQEITQTIW